MAQVYKFESVEDCMNTRAFAGAHIAFGVFDGVHSGHVALVEEMLRYANGKNNPSANTAILTFDKDPDEIFNPEKLKKLMGNEDRINFLAKLPVNSVFVLPFTREFASLEPHDFLCGLFGVAPENCKLDNRSLENAAGYRPNNHSGNYPPNNSVLTSSLRGDVEFSASESCAPNNSVPASIHVGEGFRFGARAKGDINMLREWGGAAGCEVIDVPLLQSCGTAVSSTRIRGLLASAGSKVDLNCSGTPACEPDADINLTDINTNLDLANKLLGRRYFVSGIVREGRHDGAQFGFATANLHVSPQLSVLEHGVYAAYATIDNAVGAPQNSAMYGANNTTATSETAAVAGLAGTSTSAGVDAAARTTYKAAVSVGTSPTFKEARANVEAHILDFSGDLYGKKITIEFAKYLRPMKKFSNTEDLISAISADISHVIQSSTEDY